MILRGEITFSGGFVWGYSCREMARSGKFNDFRDEFGVLDDKFRRRNFWFGWFFAAGRRFRDGNDAGETIVSWNEGRVEC